mmetsp:Transcript_80736/g.215509  ORF Transcript_80736/g.215509 Transcript_80736/m.215509 type:complete len:135 (+) Transcript_80736:119-523(+)
MSSGKDAARPAVPARESHTNAVDGPCPSSSAAAATRGPTQAPVERAAVHRERWKHRVLGLARWVSATEVVNWEALAQPRMNLDTSRSAGEPKTLAKIQNTLLATREAPCPRYAVLTLPGDKAANHLTPKTAPMK